MRLLTDCIRPLFRRRTASTGVTSSNDVSQSLKSPSASQSQGDGTAVIRMSLPEITWTSSCNARLTDWPAGSFLARDSICYSALHAISRPTVRPSVRPPVTLSHGWISQRRLKLGSRNLHHRVAPWLYTVSQKNCASVNLWITPWNIGPL